ncbi:MAG: hypothetical protein CV090_12290 [Nitrospira sp. WS238]|nr:hypothetical protein [Nitrospira sp. WS238]
MRQLKASSKKSSRPIPSTTNQAEMLIELPDGIWDRISRKAQELWVQRGRQEGNALRDWLDAEEIVMEEIHEARE